MSSMMFKNGISKVFHNREIAEAKNYATSAARTVVITAARTVAIASAVRVANTVGMPGGHARTPAP